MAKREGVKVTGGYLAPRKHGSEAGFAAPARGIEVLVSSVKIGTQWGEIEVTEGQHKGEKRFYCLNKTLIKSVWKLLCQTRTAFILYYTSTFDLTEAEVKVDVAYFIHDVTETLSMHSLHASQLYSLAADDMMIWL